MTALPTARREDAIRAVAKQYLTDDRLPYWSDTEFIHGQVRLIVDVFGVDGADASGERSAVHEEIESVWRAMKLEQAANEHLNAVIDSVDFDDLSIDRVRTLVKQAYMVGFMRGES